MHDNVKNDAHKIALRLRIIPKCFDSGTDNGGRDDPVEGERDKDQQRQP